MFLKTCSVALLGGIMELGGLETKRPYLRSRWEVRGDLGKKGRAMETQWMATEAPFTYGLSIASSYFPSYDKYLWVTCQAPGHDLSMGQIPRKSPSAVFMVEKTGSKWRHKVCIITAAGSCGVLPSDGSGDRDHRVLRVLFLTMRGRWDWGQVSWAWILALMLTFRVTPRACLPLSGPWFPSQAWAVWSFRHYDF